MINKISKAASICVTLIVLALSINAEASMTKEDAGLLKTGFGKPTYMQELHYRKVDGEMLFSDAKIYYYDNGVYEVKSQGEEHYGLYVVSNGAFKEQAYTVKLISLPSDKWGNKAAFQQLTFLTLRENPSDVNSGFNGIFLQNSTADIDGIVAQQNGTFTIVSNLVKNPMAEQLAKR